jgi:death-on-curing protein
MRYLQVGDVARLHCKALNIDEPAEVIYDLGLLESAVMRPQQMVGGVDAYADIHTKAAALFYSLCRNHAFVDGNKRTALMAIGTFYGLNGWWIEVEDGEVVALAVDVAKDRWMSPQSLARLRAGDSPFTGGLRRRSLPLGSCRGRLTNTLASFGYKDKARSTRRSRIGRQSHGLAIVRTISLLEMSMPQRGTRLTEHSNNPPAYEA